MKKLFFSIALAMIAMLSLSSLASASYTAAAGTAVTASGNITLRGNIISTACTLSLSGRVVTRNLANVTSATAACSAGRMTIATPFNKQFLLTAGGVLTGEWATTAALPGPTGFAVSVDTGLGIVCNYSVILGGRFTAGNPTVLQLNGALQRVIFVSGGGLCSTNPTITGSITLRTATA